MSFVYPLGLLGLIGIPILIVIYILKSKYSEQVVSSTYLWTLSEKFLKRKKPLSPLAGLISLLLQIIAVALISFAIAHPIITVPDSAKEYCFILDASGSMNIASDGETRFERAKDEIEQIVKSSGDGSKYTLVVTSEITTTVLEKTTDKEELKTVLSELSVGYAEPDYSDAIGVAQRLFDENPGSLTYLFTDTSYASCSNINVVNVAKGELNASVKDVSYKYGTDTLFVSGAVESFGINGTISVNVYADQSLEPLAVTQLSAVSGESVPFTVEAPPTSFSSLRVSINSNDSLALDNECIVYNIKNESTYSILIVSDTPFFMQTALVAIGYNPVVMPTENYSDSVTGYGLYIFDSYAPKTLPSDGAVWFINPVGSVAESGFTVQGEVPLDSGILLEKETTSSSVVKKLTEDVNGREIAVKQYIKCNPYRKFDTLFSYDGTPIVFAGNNSKGHREIVVAFDLHYSNLPLLSDMIVLLENFMEFSFPSVLEKTTYSAGDSVDVNIVANCDSVRVESPSGIINYLSTDTAVSSFSASEVGTYNITVNVSNVPFRYNIYSAVPLAESDPNQTSESIALVGTAQDIGFDGTFDPLMILFICLAVVFIVDWVVYCYEKYQLR